MDNQHIIEQAVFDISFGSEEEAFEQQADLGDFVKRRLMRVVDEVFDEMSTNGRVFRIDHLEIDLGTVAYNGFQGEMEGQLRERLRSVLREKLPSLRTVPAPNEGVITRERLELEQLEYFLISGRMPWNAVLGKDRTIDQLLQRVVHSTGSRFVEFLKRSPRRDTVVKRLVSQFPEEILAE
ncbi:MAG: contractile injection system tape measure protein, partial [Candidatus Poribacteria bacterium]|nr:contractile injection system tape measure protein [Candidatus Poribacteria bacterium]